jgi:uncharacterized protein (TIGR02996 family)
MVTTDGGLLLRAILAEPDEDTPRLMYADWLEEKGGSARAEFVRVQCELAGLKEPPVGFKGCVRCKSGDPADECRYHALRRRERESWVGFGSPYERSWSFGLPPNWLALLDGETDRVAVPYMPSDGVAVVRRGFVESVALPLAAFTGDAARALFAAHPVTAVRLPDREPMPDGDEGTEEVWVSWLTCREPWASADERRIPLAIAEHLPLHDWPGRSPEYRWRYPTRGDALAALSAAAVDWARGLVGLTALPGRRPSRRASSCPPPAR